MGLSKKGKLGLFGARIGKEWTPASSGKTIKIIHPSDGELIAEVSCCGEKEINQAIESALDAFHSSGWRDMRPAERADILQKMAQVYLDNEEELAMLDVYAGGLNPKGALNSVRNCAAQFRYYAGLVDKIEGSTIPTDTGDIDFTMWEPIGVTAHILPWNQPTYLFGRSVAPALAAGNTAVVKPASQTPLSALRYSELVDEKGILPKGVLNIVPGFGSEAGVALASHPSVGVVTFTGSVETGSLVTKLAAENIVPTVLELGGKSPCIVFPDADLERVLESTIFGIFTHAGQFCTARSRLFLHSSIHDEFVEKLVAKVRSLRIGKSVENPDVGPIISEGQFNKIIKYIELGKQEGARLVCGGGRPSDPALQKGYYVEPTIFVDVKSEMRIAQDEIFGPVLSVFKFDSEDEVVRMSNGVKYGLLAQIWTSDISRALRLARRLEAGRVGINGEQLAPQFPGGGYKQSGMGIDKGLPGIKNYLRLKNVYITLGKEK